ncbi:hypothetical protein HYW99_02330 [Candidatus Woesearchaeota archaeon]|nr:hypothetical protein [Candidatus Woesearchaeota archaeon]
MSKKAFEIQFNWIFVLFAGAIILLLFTVFALKQSKIAEQSNDAIKLKSVEAIISGISVSTDTSKPNEIRDLSMEVGCNRVAIGDVSRQYQSIILFGPSLIKGNSLIAQTLTFNLPYRATNLLYMTSDKLRYILIGNNDLAKEVNSSLPVYIKKEFYYTTPTINDENNYKIRFVFFGYISNEVLGNLQGMRNSDVTAIKVEGDLDKGSITFYQKNSALWESKGSSFYIGKSALIGAIYADTLYNYECNMRAAFSRLNLITKIYDGRIRRLKDASSIECQQIVYDEALPHLTTIGQFSYSLAQSSSFDQTSIFTLSSASEALENNNKDAQINSCALIY